MSIQLSSPSGNKSETSLVALNESPQERNKRIIKICLLLSAIFISSLLIPVVHFIVPPLCVIIGLTFIGKNLRHTQIKVIGTGKCPECKTDFPVAEITKIFPIKTFCPHCRNQIYIEKY